jgi:hypothetical protein
MSLKRFLFLSIPVSFLVITAGFGSAAEKIEMGGWGKGSEYNQHYQASEMDDLKGEVVAIREVVPMPGMSPGVALEVREGKGKDAETILVHLCPTWFADPKSTGIKKGDQVKIKGVWAEIEGKDVFMASKVKKGDHFEFKVRLTKDGTPFWTMSKEELAKERAESQMSKG